MEDEQHVSNDASSHLVQHDLPSLSTASSQPSGSTSTRSSSPKVESPSTRDNSSPSIEKALARLTVKEDEQERMFKSLEIIFRNAQDHERSIDLGHYSTNDLWVLLERADESSRRGMRDREALRNVRDVMDQMLWKKSQLTVAAAKTLADASRDPTWRVPFGEAGILDLFLNIIATENVSDDIALQSLRLIGNSCGDTNENRQRVIDHNSLQALISHLENPRLTPIVIPVIYNICTDYLPAQQLARTENLVPALIKAMARDPASPTATLSYACRLFDMCIEDGSLDSSPEYAVEVLLRAASIPALDVDDCISLVDVAIIYLKQEEFQRYMVTQGLVDIPLTLLVRSYSSLHLPGASYSRAGTPPIRDAQEEQQLSNMRSSLIESLSDVSALPEFSTRYAEMDSPLIDSLLRWLSVPQSQLQLCSCIMLGNLARSDLICNGMVRRLQVHKTLLSLLKDASDTQVIHSALGFLRNLSLPLQTKKILGEAALVETVARFWTPDVAPQIAYAATSLTRQILNNSLPNVRKLLASLSPDPESPAHSKTYLSLLLLLFDRSDDVTIKMEVARVVAVIFRCTHTTTRSAPERSTESILTRLHSLHPNLSRPLAMMVTQSRWPIVRSEGWFALALMVRSEEGSAAIDTILEQAEIFGALEQAIRGQSSLVRTRSSAERLDISRETVTPAELAESEPVPEQEESMRSKDRENGMVLIHELLKNRGDEMADIRRGVLEDLLHGSESTLSTQEMMNRMTRA